MPPSSWKHFGHLTPDAPDCQGDVWALLGRGHGHLAEVLEEIGSRTAEPSWAAIFRDGAERSLEVGRVLAEEAGAAALERVSSDDLLGEFELSLSEVSGSGHVPSLIAVGYAVLGELGRVPARLLEDVAGPHARLLLGQVAGFEGHRPLCRILRAADPAPRDLENLRRLTRHLNGQLFEVYRSWRQTFHTLGVDGECMDESCAATAREAAQALGLKVTRADQRVFGP